MPLIAITDILKDELDKLQSQLSIERFGVRFTYADVIAHILYEYKKMKEENYEKK